VRASSIHPTTRRCAREPRVLLVPRAARPLKPARRSLRFGLHAIARPSRAPTTPFISSPQSEAAELAGLSKQPVNDLLGELEQSGYLERKPHPADGRGRIIRLTPRGKRLQATTHQISRELEADWAARIGAERITELKQTLDDMLVSAAREDHNQSAS
jgi:DNA-binding MarR family transcriptional regulator